TWITLQVKPELHRVPAQDNPFGDALRACVRDGIVPLDANRGSAPVARSHARLVHVQRSLAHELLGDSPGERVVTLLDIEAKASWLCAGEFDVLRQVTPHDHRILAVSADQAPLQFDDTHATLNGVIAATFSRSARRSRRNS